jgi:sugar phosphate isomerase/epimerase
MSKQTDGDRKKMKLSISNIGWKKEYDETMYQFLKEEGYDGIEIAPTRIFPVCPYDHLKQAKEFSDYLLQNYSLEISSMQSIWYGKTERIFGEEKERNELIKYTKKAMDFASAASCRNLVFGCPRNRVMTEPKTQKETACDFFKELAEYAGKKGVVLALEANPPVYHTNFITDTKQAFEMVRNINLPGFLVNVDLGAMIINDEPVSILAENLPLIHHIHISEPELKLIERRRLHLELKEMLKTEGTYSGYVSIEMATRDSVDEVKETIRYIKGVFQ